MIPPKYHALRSLEFLVSQSPPVETRGYRDHAPTEQMDSRGVEVCSHPRAREAWVWMSIHCRSRSTAPFQDSGCFLHCQPRVAAFGLHPGLWTAPLRGYVAGEYSRGLGR